MKGVGGRVEGTETMRPATKRDTPVERWKDITHAQMICNCRPEKEEKERARLALGGDRTNYPGDCGTPTADVLLVKILLSGIVSTAGAEFMTGDLNFFISTHL